MSRMTRTGAGVLVAIATLVTAWVLWAGETETSFGWFAYVPLPDPPAVPNLVVITGRKTAALVVAAAGLLLLGFVAGFARGTRRHDP